MVDTKVDLGGLKMPTPVATASGTFGYGFEYLGAVDYAKLGAGFFAGVFPREIICIMLEGGDDDIAFFREAAAI